MLHNSIRKLTAIAALVAAATGLWVLVRGAQALPDRPQPIAWDRDSCAHCRMLVSEPAYAAQLITTEGRILNFDDPGCLVIYLGEHHPLVHRMWFHGAGDDAWLGPDEVAFERVPVSPMGYGFAATGRAAPGAVPLRTMARQILALTGRAAP